MGSECRLTKTINISESGKKVRYMELVSVHGMMDPYTKVSGKTGLRMAMEV